MKKKVKYYTVALRKKDNIDDCFWKHDDFVFTVCKIRSKTHWIADPFLFEKDGITYLFYELFDMISSKGCIAFSIVENEHIISEPCIVIKKDYHLSLPFIFEMNNCIYIMPETSDDYRIKLFKAINFPREWEEAEIIIPDVYACDSVLFEKDNKKYLLSSEMFHNTPTGEYSSCYVKNHLYSINNKYEIASDFGIVSEGSSGVRNAGKIMYEDRMIRVGQNCENNQYGKGIVFYKVVSVEPYQETEFFRIDCSEIKKHLINNKYNLAGSHTYNCSEQYEVIDVSYYNYERLFNCVLRMLRKIMNKMMKVK